MVTGLKRKLKKHFKVLNINEYNTSKIHYKHEVVCTNLKIKKEKEKLSHNKLLELMDKRIAFLEKCKTVPSLLWKKIPSLRLNHKVHGVLTYKKVESSSCTYGGCINRDKNSVLNMNKIFKHYMDHGIRHEKYTRMKSDSPSIGTTSTGECLVPKASI